MNLSFFVSLFFSVTYHRLPYFHENNMTENIACLKRNHADTLTKDKYLDNCTKM